MKQVKPKWSFSCIDNGGKRQHFSVTAPDKQSAIKKAMEKANKQAAGDITSWNLELDRVSLMLH